MIQGNLIKTRLRYENGEESEVAIANPESRIISGFFIKDSMEEGVIYPAVSGDREFFIAKINFNGRTEVAKLLPEEIKNVKKPLINLF